MIEPLHCDRLAHRSALLHFTADPGDARQGPAIVHHADGLLLTEAGRVLACGPAAELLPTLGRDTAVIEHHDTLLMPGFVDTHIHYPQTDVIASGGQQLLDWLNDYTFPAEQGFADAAHAAQVAEFFLDELLDNGTTTALVFGTVHPVSVDVFMQAARARQLRMIAGKVLMDRHCPPALRDTASGGIDDSRQLIERWHGVDRLQYAITPRFAATSSPAQLELAGQLARDYPGCMVHSHLAENLDEIAWVAELFPERRGYLDVYDHYGLLRERAIYAHCIHLSDAERRRMADSGARVAFSPSSNLYLGSGLFDIAAADAAGLGFGMATDVGGGSSFSMLRTLAAAYAVAKLRQQSLSPLRAFYLATLGGAKALGLETQIGSFAVGREADFVVLDLKATPLLARRCAQARRLDELLLILMTLGDDRAIRQTWVMGRPVAPRHNSAARPRSPQ